MAADIDHIIDHGCTREEMRERMKAQRQLNPFGPDAIKVMGWTTFKSKKAD
jgi:hypothetical protein